MSFDRTWGSFELPRYLMALSGIQAHVLGSKGAMVGNYSYYAKRLESLFAAPVLGALDEYGVPPTIGKKLLPLLGTDDDFDTALAALRLLDTNSLQMTAFEREVIAVAQAGL